jgi:hypothetical protein
VARAPEQDVRRQDVYKEIYAIAREIPATMAAVDVKPRALVAA